MEWTGRIRGAFVRAGHEPDEGIIEELALHAAAMHASALADGASEAEAEGRVEKQIAVWCGDAAVLRRRVRAMSVHVEPPAGISRLAGIGHDLKYAVRLMWRRPGATLVTILTMAMGIGATTMLHGVAWNVLLKPLPWPEADRLVRVSETRQGSTQALSAILTNGTYLAWRDAPATIEGLAGWASSTATLSGDGEPARVRMASVTPSLFPLLRARPTIGSVFEESEASGGDNEGVLLSFGLWQQRFGARADVLGRRIALDGVPRTVIGVMPRDFEFPDRDTRAWTRLEVPPVMSADGTRSFISMFSGIARLRPGATAAQASAEAAARGSASGDHGMTAIAVFGSKGAVQVSVVPWLDDLTADVRPALLVFLAGAVLLLATAAANIASVQLARASARRREWAVRAALGAGTRRLARQLLIENLALGVLGGALGIAAAWWAHRVLPSVLPPDFPRLDELAMDPVIAVAAFLLSLAVSLAFGLLPVMHTRRLNVVASLAGGVQSQAGAGRAAARARVWIIAGQVAVAAVLLVGASLLGRTFVAMLNADRGYDTSHVLAARMPLPAQAFPPERRARLLERIVDRLQAVPGVTAAAFTNVAPLDTADAVTMFTVPPPPGSSEPGAVQARLRIISPAYLDAMGIRLVEGRGLADTDSDVSQPVILVNRTFARRYLGDRAIGQRLPAFLEESKPDWEVVGVVDDVRMRSLAAPTLPELYVSYRQVARRAGGFQPTLVVRTSGAPVSFVPALLDIVKSEDASVALEGVGSMEHRLFDSLARPYLYAVIATTFAVLAMAIAAVGVFGVLSYTVSLRSREIAVRTALGARPSAIVRLVVRQVLAVTCVGLAAGLLASAMLGRTLAAFLYGVSPVDALTYAGVSVLLMSVAAAACWVPARRAARTDPLWVLKAG